MSLSFRVLPNFKACADRNVFLTMSMDCYRFIFHSGHFMNGPLLLRNVGNEVKTKSLFAFAVIDREFLLNCHLRFYLMRD